MAIVLVALALPLLLLELGLRAFGPFLPGEYSLGIEREYDPLLGWRHRPGLATGARTSEYAVRTVINSRGLRDEEIPYEKPRGGYRVLALGDSFLAATHVPLEQSMTKQLQLIMRQDLAPRAVDVVNAGVSGYGTAQEYLFLQAEGRRYSPDVVVLVVFLGNDLIDNIRGSDGRYERPLFDVDGEDRLIQVSGPTRDPRRRAGLDELLLRNSALFNLFESGVLRKLSVENTRTGETGQEPGADFQVYERKPSGKLRRSWEVTEALLVAVAKESSGLGARFLLVGAPSYRQLDPERFGRMVAEQNLDSAQYDAELPSRMLRSIAERNRMAYLDLLPALREGSTRGGGDMFYPRNTHWAPEGQRVVAEAIAAVVKSEGFTSDRAGRGS